jgi:hypothetical protein
MFANYLNMNIIMRHTLVDTKLMITFSRTSKRYRFNSLCTRGYRKTVSTCSNNGCRRD